MSLTIAYVRDGIVYFGTSGRMVVDGIKFDNVPESNLNVKRLDNGIIAGVDGSTQFVQYVLANSDVFTLAKDGTLTKEHIVKHIIPALYKALGEFESDELGKTYNDNKLVGDVILAHKDRLFHISRSQMSVFKINNFCAIGPQHGFPCGMMFRLDSEKSVEPQLVNIVKSTSRFSEQVNAPYVTINTRDLKYKFWEE